MKNEAGEPAGVTVALAFPSSATYLWAEVRAGRTSPRSSRPPTTSAGAKCTCGEAVRFPDEQREELCEAKSQEGARSPTRSSRSSRRESCPPRRRFASTRSPSSPTRGSWKASPKAKARPRTQHQRSPPKVDAPAARSQMPEAATAAGVQAVARRARRQPMASVETRTRTAGSAPTARPASRSVHAKAVTSFFGAA